MQVELLLKKHKTVMAEALDGTHGCNLAHPATQSQTYGYFRKPKQDACLTLLPCNKDIGHIMVLMQHSWTADPGTIAAPQYSRCSCGHPQSTELSLPMKNMLQTPKHACTWETHLLMSEKKSKELPGTGKGSEVCAALSNTRKTPSCISKSNGATGWGSHLKGSPLMCEGAAASCMPGCCSAGDTLAVNSHLSLHQHKCLPDVP